ncbi:Ldh family oxidoreductase [Niabella terrae]
MKIQNFSVAALRDFTVEVFRKIGVPDDQAATAAAVLLLADVRGVDSHGVARLNGYVRLRDAGRVNVQPDIKIIHETPSTAVVDGDSGLGLVVAPFAMQVAIEKAAQAGTGWVSVQNSNHYGIAAAHAMQALDRDMIGISMTNASPLVAPTFSTAKMLGTNPICVAAPAGKEPPFVMDLATTTAANGKLEILQRKQQAAPQGWVQDAEGRSTDDAAILKKGGALLPLGGDPEHGSHKGYALGAMVDLFSALLSGANFAPWVPPFPAYVPMPARQPGKGIGHFFGAMRVDAFRSVEAYKRDMDDWIGGFRSAATLPGHDRVLVPGDPEREIQAVRSTAGIPLLEPVVEDLRQLAATLDLNFPLPEQ